MPINVLEKFGKAGSVPGRPGVIQETDGQKKNPRNLIAEFTRAPVNLAAEEGDKSIYEMAHTVKRDALIRPDIQKALNIATGGRFDTFMKSDLGEDIIDIPIQAAIGYTSSMTFGLPQLLTADFIHKDPSTAIQVAKGVMTPDNDISGVTNSIASLIGLSGPLKLISKLKPVAALSRLRPTTAQGVLAKRMIAGGFKLGTYSVLSTHGGKSFMDNIKMRGGSGMVGAGMGAAFSMAHGITGDLVKRGASRMGLKITDPATHLTAFATRLGINEYFTGYQSFKELQRGEGSIPKLVYEVGLGIMFSLSNNPLRLEAEFNKAVQHKYKLNKMTPTELGESIRQYNSYDEIPSDIKWAYIIKATNGRIKPTYQNSGDMMKNEQLRITNPGAYEKALNNGQVTSNIGSTDYIFDHVLKHNAPVVREKFDFLTKFKVDAEIAFDRMLGSKPTTEQVNTLMREIQLPVDIRPVAEARGHLAKGAITAQQIGAEINNMRGISNEASREWANKAQQILEYSNAKWYEKKSLMSEAGFKRWFAKDKDYKKMRNEMDHLWGIHRDAATQARKSLGEARKLRAEELRTERAVARKGEQVDLTAKTGGILVERRGDPTGAFYAPRGESTHEFGESISTMMIKNTAKIKEMESSYSYAENNGLLNKPMPGLTRKYGKKFKTLNDLWDNVGDLPGEQNQNFLETQLAVAKHAAARGRVDVIKFTNEDILNKTQYMVLNKNVLAKPPGVEAVPVGEENKIRTRAADKATSLEQLLPNVEETVRGAVSVLYPRTFASGFMSGLKPKPKFMIRVSGKLTDAELAAAKESGLTVKIQKHGVGGKETTSDISLPGVFTSGPNELRKAKTAFDKFAELVGGKPSSVAFTEVGFNREVKSPIEVPPVATSRTYEVRAQVRYGGNIVSSGMGNMKDNTMNIGFMETQPDFRRKGAGSRVLRQLIDEGVKQNPNLEKVTGITASREGYELANKFGAKFYMDGKEVPGQAVATVLGTPQQQKKFEYTIDVRSNDFAISRAGKEAPELSWSFPAFQRQEGDLRAEMATGKDITSLKRMAKHVGLLYKSKNNKEVTRNITKFLSTYYNIPLKEVKSLTKPQIEEAKQFMQQLVPGPRGNIVIPRVNEMLPVEYFDKYFGRKGNIFDWLQSGRIAIRPIYDQFKPAYQRLQAIRTTQFNRLNSIYGGKIKRGSKADKQLAAFADGILKLEQLPEGIREIAVERRTLYNEYADRLLADGLIKKGQVFFKDGSRKPYYHRIFDSAITSIFDKGFAIEDIWMPGAMPVAGALRKRTGGKDYRHSAIESDTAYINGVEKYLALKDANRVSLEYAKQYKGMRQEMAKVYIRSMRGQPTHVDKALQETWQGINQTLAGMMQKVGMKSGAAKLRASVAPAYPVSRITSPIARVYYWRYIGLAIDTSLKNSIQWQHAMARYGVKNTAKATYRQFTEEGKGIIEAADLHSEGIKRGGHFIAESNKVVKLSHIEEASYFLWSQFDKNNRNISGLAAYYSAIDKGMMPQQAIREAQKGSHETQFGYCVTPDTECLTISGWKSYNELNIGDSIFTLNMGSNILEIEPIKELGVFNYSGNMVHINNQSIDKVMTPNHRCVVRSRNDKNKIVRADKLVYSHRLARVADYIGVDEIISDDMVRLVGWSVTEGQLTKFRNCKTARNFRLYQSFSQNQAHTVEIEQLLNRLGGHYNVSTRIRDNKISVMWSLRKPLSDDLYSLAPSNRLTTEFIMKLSKRQCEILLQVMVDGDGWRSKSNNGIFFTQSLRKKENITNWQILAYLAGYTCTLYKERKDDSGVFFIAFASKRTQNTTVGKCKREIIDYSGEIWCPVVDNGTWVARRNGKIFITGNTKADSMLVDMANPMWRFVMFKKWPMAKVEMIRQWVRDGQNEAVFNLAMQEYMLYKGAQAVGVDLGSHLSAIWSFAVRGISSPTDMIPAVSELYDIGQMLDGDERAKERVINTWQGFGNRYVSKGMNFMRAWQDDWNVREHNGQLIYKSNPNEQMVNMFTRSLESSKRRADMQRMGQMKNDISAMRDKVSQAILDGDSEKAGKLNNDMLNKYSQDMRDYFAKELQPVTMEDVLAYKQRQETDAHERLRRSLPGRGPQLPTGHTFKGKERKPRNLLESFRGF